MKNPPISFQFHPNPHHVSEATGRKLQQELNENGVGESFFIACDIRKEQDLKVNDLTSQMSLILNQLILAKRFF